MSPCRILVFACAAVFSSVPVLAQTPDPIAADRPGIADSSAVVGPGRLQIETGVQWEKRRSEFSTFFPTLFRVGLSSRLEARVEGDTYTTIADHDLHESGLTPVALGFKALLTPPDGEGRAAAGVIVNVTPAWGTGTFASDHVSADVRLVCDWDLSDHWALTPNAGLAWTRGESGHFIPGLFALTLSYAPGRRVQWFIDAGAEVPEAQGGAASLIIDAGIAYIPRRNWQLDISAGTRAHGDTAPRPFIGAGVSWRLGR